MKRFMGFLQIILQVFKGKIPVRTHLFITKAAQRVKPAFVAVFLLVFLGFEVPVSLSQSSISPSSDQASKKEWVHGVDENARTLSAIALFLYGKSRDFKKIADWNNIAAPYRIKLKQKLILKERPRLSRDQGSAILLKYWRKRFGLEDKAASVATVDPKILVAKQKEEKKAEIKQKFEEAKIQIESKAQEVIFEATSAEQLFQEGKRFFDEKNFEKAFEQFRRSREADPEYLPPWFFEIRSLHALNRSDEEEKTKELLVQRHPKLSALPFLKKRAPAGAAAGGGAP